MHSQKKSSIYNIRNDCIEEMAFFIQWNISFKSLLKSFPIGIFLNTYYLLIYKENAFIWYIRKRNRVFTTFQITARKKWLFSSNATFRLEAF